MKPARLAVLVVAVAAAGGAALLMNQTSAPPPPVQAPVVAAAPVSTVEVLVTSTDLAVGQTIRGAELRWQSWPKDLVPPGAIQRSLAPGALEDMQGSIVRQSFMGGEPVRREKLVKANGSGFMAAVLPSGMRAVAVSIDTRGANSAGGFILPNDRVDVVRIGRDDEATKAGGTEVQTAQTILSNIRVLAIGQNVQERNGEKVVTGDTATLEVTQSQAEMLAVAQKSGQLMLSLRSITDAVGMARAPDEGAETSGLTVVRYGVPQTIAKR